MEERLRSLEEQIETMQRKQQRTRYVWLLMLAVACLFNFLPYGRTQDKREKITKLVAPVQVVDEQTGKILLDVKSVRTDDNKSSTALVDLYNADGKVGTAISAGGVSFMSGETVLLSLMADPDGKARVRMVDGELELLRTVPAENGQRTAASLRTDGENIVIEMFNSQGRPAIKLESTPDGEGAITVRSKRGIERRLQP